MNNTTCANPECTEVVGAKGAKGLCPKHYRLSRPPCTIEGCSKPQRSQGFCGMHHRRFQTTGDPLTTVSGRVVREVGELCAAPDCENLRRKLDWCSQHYVQFRKLGAVGPLRYQWRERAGLPCEVCGEPCETRSTRCSDACAAVAVRWSAKGEERPTTAPCKLCGKDIRLQSRSGQRLPRTDVIYCKECGPYSPDARRFRRYGITPDVYAAALERGCDICGGYPDVLHIDHDHNCCSGKKARLCGSCNRGFLCGPCNRALGMFRDDPAIVRNAIRYLNAA